MTVPAATVARIQRPSIRHNDAPGRGPPSRRRLRDVTPHQVTSNEELLAVVAVRWWRCSRRDSESQIVLVYLPKNCSVKDKLDFLGYHLKDYGRFNRHVCTLGGSLRDMHYEVANNNKMTVLVSVLIK